MANIIEGKLNAKGMKIAIIVGRFNDFITSKLLEGALDCIKRHDGDTDLIDVCWVPGAYEIPYMAKQSARVLRVLPKKGIYLQPSATFRPPVRSLYQECVGWWVSE